MSESVYTRRRQLFGTSQSREAFSHRPTCAQSAPLVTLGQTDLKVISLYIFWTKIAKKNCFCIIAINLAIPTKKLPKSTSKKFGYMHVEIYIADVRYSLSQ